MALKFGLKPSYLDFLRHKAFYTCLLCVWFVVYNSMHLIEKAGTGKVVHNSNYERINKMPFITACLAIDSGSYNCSRVQSLYRKCEELEELFRFIESNEIFKTPREMFNRVDNLKIRDFILFSAPSKYKFSEYFLNYNHLCFKYECEHCDTPVKGAIQNAFKLSYSVFFHDEENPIEFNKYLGTQICSQFESCTSQALNLEKYKFKLLSTPYSTDCLDYEEQRFSFQSTILIKSQLECLNECNKHHFISSYFFYKSNNPLNLNYTFTRNLTEKDFENLPAYRKCFKLCSKPDCLSTRYFVKSIDNKQMDDMLIFSSDLFSINIEARPFINQFELFLTLLGFVSLIFSLDALLLSIKAGNRLTKLFKYHSNALKAIFVLNWSFMLLLICFSISQSLKLSSDYLNDGFQDSYQVYYLSKPETNFNLHLCYPLSRMVQKSPFLFQKKFNHSKELNYVREFLSENKLGDLIRQTYNATLLIEKIGFDFGLKRVAIPFENDPKKVFFKWHSIREGEAYMPQKCFTVKIDLKNHYFQNLFKSARIKVRSKSEHSSYYLTDRNLKITSFDQPLISYRETIKMVVIRHPSKCSDYKRLYGCNSYWDCLNQCIFKKFSQNNKIHMYYFRLENLSNHSTHSLVFEEDLEPFERECRSMYTKFDCKVVTYENEKTHIEHTESATVRIFPSFFTTAIIQEEPIARRNDFFFVMLNLCTVLVGLNAFTIYKTVYKLTAKLVDARLCGCLNVKIDLLAKLLFCVLFVLHVMLIFTNTFSVGLRNGLTIDVKTELSKLSQLPEINLCFNYKSNKTEGALNGLDLDRLTQEIRIDAVISSMVYLNEKGEEQVWLPSEAGVGNQFFKFDHFYFLNKKCLNIVNYFKAFSTSHKHFLKIILNGNFSQSTFYICSNRMNKKTLSKLNRLSMRDEFYEIFLDVLHLNRNDVLESFENPFLLYRRIRYRDLEEFVPMLRNAFLQAYNSTTRWLPLTQDLFGYPIRDGLFERFYTENFHRDQSKFFSDNFDLMFFRDNILIEKSFQQIYNLKFNSEHFYIKNEAVRRESFLSFMVSLLNSISFWFALSLSQALNRLLDFLISIYKNRIHPLIFEERPVNYIV